MLNPNKTTAVQLLDELYERTESKEGLMDRELWRAHSFRVAESAALIAEKIAGIEVEAAFVFGLLHDIGKGIDYLAKKHALEGYRYLNRLGYREAAYVALTHDFPIKEFEIHRQEALLTEDELATVMQLLQSHEYSVYDRLIQVCDVISLPQHYVLMEKRMLLAVLRSGLSDSLKQIIEASYENIRFIESLLGASIYSVLPGVAAWQRGEEICAYLSALPLDLVREIHLSAPIMDEHEGLRDRHLEMQDEDYVLLQWVLTQTRPDILTLEYGGFGPPFSWRSDQCAVERQLHALRALCDAKQEESRGVY